MIVVGKRGIEASCSIRRKIGEIWADSTVFSVDQFLPSRFLEFVFGPSDLKLDQVMLVLCSCLCQCLVQKGLALF